MVLMHKGIINNDIKMADLIQRYNRLRDELFIYKFHQGISYLVILRPVETI